MFQALFSTFLTLIAMSVQAANTNWAPIRTSLLANNRASVIEQLLKLDESKLNPDDQALRHFTLGVTYYSENNFNEARNQLGLYIEKKGRLSAYAYYYLGRVYYDQGDKKTAERFLTKALTSKPPRNYQYETKYLLGQIAYEQKNYRTAYRYFSYVERKWRGTNQHPEVLWKLIEAEFARGRTWKACRWARTMYRRYPLYNSAATWNFELNNAMIANKQASCAVNFRDQAGRLRQLFWSGLPNRAEEELESLKVKANGISQYYKDSLKAGLLLDQGYPKESLDLLMKYYGEQKNNYQYNMLLAKAAARADEYHAAVGAFLQGYRLTRRSREGRNTLFKAAFLAYQYQDYDLSIKSFSELVKTHKRSGLSKDARWYLAWSKYLKGDYTGALAEFDYIVRQKKRNRWKWARLATEKIRYWRGMTLFKLGDYLKAKAAFEPLAKDGSLGFYAITAQHRLQQVLAEIKKSPLLAKAASERDPASNYLEVSAPKTLLPAQSDIENAESESDEIDSDTRAVEESLRAEVEDGPEKFFKSILEDKDDEVEPDEPENVTDYEDPRLKIRFDRVKDLILVGFNEMAKWELYEIERRTSNENYRKSLMGAYAGIEAFNRSSYMAQIYFGQQRKKYGVHGIRYLWEYSYPRPFSEAVNKVSKDFSVASEFVWSIMRAESKYRPTIESPVGAKGLMQIMPNTGKKVSQLLGESQFEVDSLFDPAVNVRLGTRYLQRLLKMFDNQVPLAAAGYNAGPHRVENWLHQFGQLDMDEFIEHIPFFETRNYVKKVTRNFSIYNILYNNSNKATEFLSREVAYDKVNHEPAKRESWETL